MVFADRLPSAIFMPLFGSVQRDVPTLSSGQTSQNLVRNIVDMVGQAAAGLSTASSSSSGAAMPTAQQQAQSESGGGGSGPRIVNTASSGSTMRQPPVAHTGIAQAGNTHHPRYSHPASPNDPFLPCHSRHFAVTGLSQGGRRTRLRRGRSADANFQDSVTRAATAEPAPTPVTMTTTTPASLQTGQQQVTPFAVHVGLFPLHPGLGWKYRTLLVLIGYLYDKKKSFGTGLVLWILFVWL